MVNGTEGDLHCGRLVETSTRLYTWVDSLSRPPAPLDVERLGECLQRGSPLFADVLIGFNQSVQPGLDFI